jgi:hypothetical protein
MTAKIATGEIDESTPPPMTEADGLRWCWAAKAAQSAATMTANRQKEIAKMLQSRGAENNACV